MKFRKVNLGYSSEGLDPAIGHLNIPYAEGDLEMLTTLFSFVITNNIVTKEVKNKKSGNWFNLERGKSKIDFVQCFKHANNMWVINFENNKCTNNSMWCCEGNEGLVQLSEFIKKYGVNADLSTAVVRDLHIEQILND
jgi:hypothetical protein